MLAFYHLKNCSSCKRIIKELGIGDFINLIDIKNNPISENELQLFKSLSGSYESLFSKKAQLYNKRMLKEKNLTENDYKKLILEHYTFLKRPILVFNKNIFVGNSSKIIQQAKEVLDGQK